MSSEGGAIRIEALNKTRGMKCRGLRDVAKVKRNRSRRFHLSSSSFSNFFFPLFFLVGNERRNAIEQNTQRNTRPAETINNAQQSISDRMYTAWGIGFLSLLSSLEASAPKLLLSFSLQCFSLRRKCVRYPREASSRSKAPFSRLRKQVVNTRLYIHGEME